VSTTKKATKRVTKTAAKKDKAPAAAAVETPPPPATPAPAWQFSIPTPPVTSTIVGSSGSPVRLLTFSSGTWTTSTTDAIQGIPLADIPAFVPEPTAYGADFRSKVVARMIQQSWEPAAAAFMNTKFDEITHKDLMEVYESPKFSFLRRKEDANKNMLRMLKNSASTGGGDQGRARLGAPAHILQDISHILALRNSETKMAIADCIQATIPVTNGVYYGPADSRKFIVALLRPIFIFENSPLAGITHSIAGSQRLSTLFGDVGGGVSQMTINKNMARSIWDAPAFKPKMVSLSVSYLVVPSAGGAATFQEATRVGIEKMLGGPLSQEGTTRGAIRIRSVQRAPYDSSYQLSILTAQNSTAINKMPGDILNAEALWGYAQEFFNQWIDGPFFYGVMYFPTHTSKNVSPTSFTSTISATGDNSHAGIHLRDATAAKHFAEFAAAAHPKDPQPIVAFEKAHSKILAINTFKPDQLTPQFI